MGHLLEKLQKRFNLSDRHKNICQPLSRALTRPLRTILFPCPGLVHKSVIQERERERERDRETERDRQTDRQTDRTRSGCSAIDRTNGYPELKNYEKQVRRRYDSLLLVLDFYYVSVCMFVCYIDHLTPGTCNTPEQPQARSEVFAHVLVALSHVFVTGTS